MKLWTSLGLLLLIGVGVALVASSPDRSGSGSAQSYLTELAARLDEFARLHNGRFPVALEELETTKIALRRAHVLDPWNRPYVYERHPDDEHKCRVYTLGEDGEPSRDLDPTELVLYRLPGGTTWRRSLLDVPREWEVSETSNS